MYRSSNSVYRNVGVEREEQKLIIELVILTKEEGYFLLTEQTSNKPIYTR